jgi:hypothetical protein
MAFYTINADAKQEIVLLVSTTIDRNTVTIMQREGAVQLHA